ncbi:hypothetical protein [Methyloterricola oryzae]|uniref:hypothetical protein n=1 Tax=Methyloterricola oryzae TaxID=1495050 RepID=UPI0005EB0C3C|nr:hypothetical protein [Methyloterricola oryzae]
MPPKKRGLGRGLEALLTDVLIKVEAQDGDAGELEHAGPALRESGGAGQEIPALQQERLALLEEAETLRALIEDLERLARAD